MKATGWAVVAPNGRVDATTFATNEFSATRKFVGRDASIRDVPKVWAEWRKVGYRCVPVTIEWRE